MTEKEIYEFLTETFATIFERPIEVHPELSAKDVAGWDSFAQISIIAATEEHFNFEFSSRELDGLRNVGDFVRIVSAKLRP